MILVEYFKSKGKSKLLSFSNLTRFVVDYVKSKVKSRKVEKFVMFLIYATIVVFVFDPIYWGRPAYQLGPMILLATMTAFSAAMTVDVCRPKSKRTCEPFEFYELVALWILVLFRALVWCVPPYVLIMLYHKIEIFNLSHVATQASFLLSIFLAVFYNKKISKFVSKY